MPFFLKVGRTRRNYPMGSLSGLSSRPMRGSRWDVPSWTTDPTDSSLRDVVSYERFYLHSPTGIEVYFTLCDLARTGIRPKISCLRGDSWRKPWWEERRKSIAIVFYHTKQPADASG
jgi:hypothetical protein